MRSTHRRVAETAQLLVAVMGTDDHTSDAVPLRAGGRGFTAVRGVRLMHAAVRALWVAPPGSAEVAVNQADLVGTLLTFTVVVFDGLERLGLGLTDEERDDYLHLWLVVGHLLGIDDAWLSTVRADPDGLARVVRTELDRPTPHGVGLMHALRAEMRANMPIGLRGLPDALVHDLIGRAAADALHVPRPGWTRALVAASRAGGRLWTRAPGREPRRAIARVVARRMIRSYIERGRPGERAPWDYAEHLERWKLTRKQPARARRRDPAGRITRRRSA